MGQVLDVFKEPLIESKAAAHLLPPDLIQATILVESSGNPFATRFEPGVAPAKPDTPQLLTSG